MKIFLMFLMMTGVAHGALADSFEERESLALRKSLEEPLRRIKDQAYAESLKDFRALRGFAAAHSGMRADPICLVYDFTYGCVGGYCVSDTGESKGKIRLSALKPSAQYFISYCDINLNEGLMCRASLVEHKGHSLDATCYDKSGNRYEYTMP